MLLIPIFLEMFVLRDIPLLGTMADEMVLLKKSWTVWWLIMSGMTFSEMLLWSLLYGIVRIITPSALSLVSPRVLMVGSSSVKKRFSDSKQSGSRLIILMGL